MLGLCGCMWTVHTDVLAVCSIYMFCISFLDQELITYYFSSFSCFYSCSCWGNRLQKTPKAPSFQFGSGMKFGRNVLQVIMHWSTESDFQFCVALSRWRPWRHFMQKSAAIWWIHTYAAYYQFSLQFLIHSTFALVLGLFSVCRDNLLAEATWLQ